MREKIAVIAVIAVIAAILPQPAQNRRGPGTLSAAIGTLASD